MFQRFNFIQSSVPFCDDSTVPVRRKNKSPAIENTMGGLAEFDHVDGYLLTSKTNPFIRDEFCDPMKSTGNIALVGIAARFEQ
jgi:hypothetical protein